MSATRKMQPEAEALAYATDDERWAAVQARDARRRRPLRLRRAHHRGLSAARARRLACPGARTSSSSTRERAAEAAGYRASRRASGDRTVRSRRSARHAVAKACRLIERSETPPNLDELAEEVGMSPFHFHRVFKAETGLTPKAYASAPSARTSCARSSATRAATVTDAIYGAGFNSEQPLLRGIRRHAGHARARLPRRWPQHANPLRGGPMLAGRDPGRAEPARHLRHLAGRRSRAASSTICRTSSRKALLIGGDAGFERLVAQVVGFVEAPSLGLNLPLDVRGTAFQERVWQALREIPPGATVSYAQVAARIGQPKAVRAVAQACGGQPSRRRDPVPSRGAPQRRALRLSLGRRAQARIAEARDRLTTANGRS